MTASWAGRMHMYRRRIRVVTSIALFMLLATAFAVAEEELEPGTVVFGEWFENQWYNGTIQEACTGGYLVLAETGEEKCVPIQKIVLDVVPDADDVTVGARVLAQWGGGLFYPGEVSAIRGDSYDIQYDDGDRATVDRTKIRLEGNHDAAGVTVVTVTPTEVLDESLILERDGQVWAQIQQDGTIIVEGSTVGAITADGLVSRADGVIGEVDTDGMIRVNGVRSGEIEQSGRLWRGGSPIGSVIVNGDIYLGSSKWGSIQKSVLSYREQRIAAALVAFFSQDFGFIR